MYDCAQVEEECTQVWTFITQSHLEGIYDLTDLMGVWCDLSYTEVEDDTLGKESLTSLCLSFFDRLMKATQKIAYAHHFATHVRVYRSLSTV